MPVLPSGKAWNARRTQAFLKATDRSRVRRACQGRAEWQIRTATTDAELRALAYLRARCFNAVPEGRSAFAQRSFRRMKADAEWDSVQQKVAGTATGWTAVRVVPIIATIVHNDAQPLAAEVLRETDDLSSALPAASAESRAELVIGTLDVNIGATLPAEELVGSLPKVDAANTRAYLSNVCVASGARGKGVAKDLVRAAQRLAADRGVVHLYVHVETDNVAAAALYSACGFQEAAREGIDVAHKRQHTQRLLLGRSIAKAHTLDRFGEVM